MAKKINYCEIEVDVRTIPGQKVEAITQVFKSVIDHDVEIEVIDFKQPVETDPSNLFVKLCQDILKSVQGEKLKLKGVSYFSDASIICNELNIPMVIIGPRELGMSGQQDEWVNTNNLEPAAKTYYEIAKKYLT